MNPPFFSAPSFAQAYFYQNLSDTTLNRILDVDEVVQDCRVQLENGSMHAAGAFKKMSFIEKKIRRLLRREDKEQLRANIREPSEMASIYHEAEERQDSERSPLEKAVLHSYTVGALQSGLKEIRAQWANAWRFKNRQYDEKINEKNNGLPPFRRSDGTPINIKKIISVKGRSSSGYPYTAEQAWQFIDPSLSEEERANLYRKLECRDFRESDLKDENERVMLPQGDKTVAALEPIPARTCIGAYGGFGLDKEDLIAWPDEDELPADVPEIEPDDTYIITHDKKYRGKIKSTDGRNILSRINTIFEWENGQPVAQAKDGYNVEFVDFLVLTEEDTIECITFVFTTKAVEADEELRLNYHYSRKAIKKLFQKLFQK